ncbi:hypothetical protein JYT20_00950, partial [Rhodothermus sp. AH-315-K08]|nr:hypothetical protein [Rhodothermus sp. AH-315-K08]
AQSAQHSRNVSLIAHVPLGAGEAGGVVLDQSRPLAFAASGASVVVVHTTSGKRIGSWETPEQARITAITLLDRALVVGTARGLWMVDVSDPERPSQAFKVSSSEVRAAFAYQHSNGTALVMIATGQGVTAVTATGQEAGTISLPEEVTNREDGVYDVYAAYELASESDRLYVAGAGGYFVYDISDLTSPELLTWVSSAAIQIGTTIQATPDGTQLVTGTDYRTSPIRIFDLRPALDGTVSQVRTAVGAWTANWRSHSQTVEVRWPYVFVAAREQGLQMFNMRNAFEPYTTAHFKTWNGGDNGSDAIGAVDVDVRNEDGLIAVTDVKNGLWLLTIDDFTGWDGRGWGLPNVSSVQDWVNGPVNSDRWIP